MYLQLGRVLMFKKIEAIFPDWKNTPNKSQMSIVGKRQCEKTLTVYWE